MKRIFVFVAIGIFGAMLLQAQPVITSDLTNQTVLNGSSVTFAVGVSGTGPFTYQWQFNGTNLPNNIITTVAGNGGQPFSGDGGPATNASLYSPSGVSLDSFGNIYIADGLYNRIRKVDTNGIIMTVAGNGNEDYSGDGVAATNTSLYNPNGVVVDAVGDLYIGDSANHRVRKVDTNGIITTVVGNDNNGYFGNFSGDGGPSTNATVNYPFGIALDSSGDLFIADSGNNRVRRVDTNGIITTVAGNGNAVYAGDGGFATNAALNNPLGVWVDNPGNLYVADSGNNRIRKVDTNGIITTVAGGGSGGDGGAATNAALNNALATVSTPLGVTMDAVGNIYIADGNKCSIRKVNTNGIITTVAGNGSQAFGGDGGIATNASFSIPYGVALDSVGDIYIADTGNNRIREVHVAGYASLALTNVSTTNSGNYSVVITDASGSITSAVVTLTVVLPPTILVQPFSPGGSNTTINVIAGGTPPLYYWWYNNFTNLVQSGTNESLAVSNFTGQYTVVITNSYGSVTSQVAIQTFPPSLIEQPVSQTVLAGSNITFNVAAAGLSPLTYQWQFNGTNLPNNIISTVAGGGSNNPGNGGAATNAQLSTLFGIAADNQGNYYIADYGACRIRRVDTNGIITTVAGNGTYGHSGDGGAATNASLYSPDSVAIDSQDNLYITEYIGGCIRKVDTNGIITTVAGNGTSGYSGDGGQATNASLDYPEGIVLDSFGDLLIADSGNNLIREVSTNGIITTFAGTNVAGFSGDQGPATNAYLKSPSGVTFDNNGNLLIADTGNNRVREVNTNGVISTLVGNGLNGFAGDGGAATNGSLSGPYAVTVDQYGYMFIADRGNSRVRQVDLNSIITTVAGNGLDSFSGDGGSATNAALNFPAGVVPAPSGNILIVDQSNNRIREITLGRSPSSFQLTDVSSNNTGSYDVIVAGPFGGSLTSSIVNLTVVYPPSVTGQPQGVIVTNGSPAQFAVSASGTGPLDYQWFDGANEVLDATNSTLIFTNVNTNEIGNYTCVVTNNYGGITSSIAKLVIVTPLIILPPSIVAQLTNETILQGSNVKFNVGVAGTGPFSYQWQFNGTNLPNGNGLLTPVAGIGGSGYGGDGGQATNASLAGPSGMAIDSYGDIFIDDQLNNRIRMVNTNGIIKTIAGIGPNVSTGSYSGDGGPATSAGLNLNIFNEPYPSGVALDSVGNVYIADIGNNRIRMVNTNGIITTLAGTNTAGFSGDGGQAIKATFKSPAGVAVDEYGDIFIADTLNNRIREIGTNGIITTVAGTGVAGFSGDGGPAVDAQLNVPVGVAVDSTGNLFIADMNNNRIREVNIVGIISTLAGTNSAGFSGDGSPAANASLDEPIDVAVDAADDVFIADDLNYRARMVDVQGIISTVAGGGTAFTLNWNVATNADVKNVSGVGLDSNGNLYVGLSYYSYVRKVGFARVPTLQLTNLVATNAGNYDVIVTSPFGSVTSSIVSLSVLLPPAVIVQPTNIVASVGDPVNFSVKATNYPPFGYQWFISSARTAESTPMVLSPFGQILSVYITDPGEGYISTPNVHFVDTRGSGATATASISNGGVTSVRVTFQGFNYSPGTIVQIDSPPTVAVPLLDDTNAALTLPSITSANFTNYFVVITNAYGSVTSSIAAIFPPNPPTSFLVQNVGSGFQLTFSNGTSSYPYILQSTTNLIPPINWVPIATNNAGNFGTWRYTDTNANGIQEFYRVIAQ